MRYLHRRPCWLVHPVASHARILKSALAEECQVQSICSTIYPSKPRARASTRTPYFSMIHDPSMPSMGRMLQWWASPFSIHHEPDG